MNIEKKGICYVIPRVNELHGIIKYKYELVWYPEDNLSLYERVQYKPFIKSIVTEDPWIISCYDKEDVRIWRNGNFNYPNDQTYGASVNKILIVILGVPQTIPSYAYDGGVKMREVEEKLKKEYKTSQIT